MRVWLPRYLLDLIPRSRESGVSRDGPRDDFSQTSTFPRRDPPESCLVRVPLEMRGRRECRVRAAPAVSCASAQKSAHASIQGSGEHPTFPAQWFCGLYALSPVTGLCCHRRPGIITQDLIPASGDQDHAISPHVPAPFVLRAPTRPSHPASNVRDDRDTPLQRRRDVQRQSWFSENRKRNIFSGKS
jgi:hypothetical protein